MIPWTKTIRKSIHAHLYPLPCLNPDPSFYIGHFCIFILTLFLTVASPTLCEKWCRDGWFKQYFTSVYEPCVKCCFSFKLLLFLTPYFIKIVSIFEINIDEKNDATMAFQMVRCSESDMNRIHSDGSKGSFKTTISVLHSKWDTNVFVWNGKNC